MTLGFMQSFPWATKKNPAPTHFREKILAGVGLLNTPDSASKIKERYGVITHPSIVYKPKIHTFREDKHNRWREGMKIEMVYRGPKYSIKDHFNKNIPELQVCTGTQRIAIIYKQDKLFPSKSNIEIWVDDYLILEASTVKGSPYIGITHYYRHTNGIIDFVNTPTQLICYNDGFDSAHDFFRWFTKSWEGKIIHWTDFRY